VPTSAHNRSHVILTLALRFLLGIVVMAAALAAIVAVFTAVTPPEWRGAQTQKPDAAGL
jgi:hypothetical protein